LREGRKARPLLFAASTTSDLSCRSPALAPSMGDCPAAPHGLLKVPPTLSAGVQLRRPVSSGGQRRADGSRVPAEDGIRLVSPVHPSRAWGAVDLDGAPCRSVTAVAQDHDFVFGPPSNPMASVWGEGLTAGRDKPLSRSGKDGPPRGAGITVARSPQTIDGGKECQVLRRAGDVARARSTQLCTLLCISHWQGPPSLCSAVPDPRPPRVPRPVAARVPDGFAGCLS